MNRLTRVFYPWRWLLLGLAAPFLLFPNPFTPLVFILVPLVVMLALFAGDEPFPRGWFSPALLLFAVMVLVSLFVTYDPLVSLPKIAGMLLAISAFIICVSYAKSMRGFWLSILAFVLISLGVAFFGLLGGRWSLKYPFLGAWAERLTVLEIKLPGAEGGVSPNEIAGALLWAMPLVFALTLIAFVEHRRHSPTPPRWLAPTRWFLVEASLFLGFVFFLTQSRSSYLALALTGIVFLRLFLPAKARLLFVGGISIVLLVLVVVTNQFGLDAILGQVIGYPQLAEMPQSLGTLRGRIPIWGKAIVAIQSAPLTGIGMNTFRYLIETFDSTNRLGMRGDVAHAHNEFLQAALDLGIPGLIGLIALYIGAAVMLKRVWERARDDLPGSMADPQAEFFLSPLSMRLLVAGLGGGLLAHFLYGLVDAVALGAKPGVLFWMLLGLIVGLYHHSSKNLEIK